MNHFQFPLSLSRFVVKSAVQKPALIISLLLVLGLNISYVSANTPNPNIENAENAERISGTENDYEKALQSFYQQQYQASVIHLKNVLKQKSDHLPARVLLAENLIAQGKGAQAESEVNKLIALNADKGRTALLLANSLLIQGKSQQVLEIVLPANAKVRMKSELAAFRGLAYLNENKLILAINELDEALMHNPRNSSALLGKAKIDIKQKQWTGALTQINQVLAFEADNKQALFMAAVVNQLSGNSKQALANINSLIQAYPTHYSALITRAMILINLGELAQASADIEIVAQKFPHEPITQFTANITNQDNNSALELSSLINSIPEELKQKQPVYYLLAALANIRKQAFEKAEKSLFEYHRLVPNDVPAIKLLARTRIALGTPFTAKKDLFKARTLSPDDVEVWLLLGQVSVLTQDNAKAKYYFNEVLRKSPTHLEATINLAKLNFVQGDSEQTITLLTPLLISNLTGDQQTEVLLMLAKCYQAKNDYLKALSYTEQLISLQPLNSYAHQLHGSLQGLTGNIAAAHQSYLTASQLDSENFQVVIKLARLEVALDKLPQAISRLEQHNQLKGNSAVMIELANIYAGAKQIKAATQWFEKALAHNPSSILALSSLVELALNQNQHQAALTLAEQFIEKNSKNAEAHALAAKLYLKTGSSNKAINFMNRAVKLSNNKAERFIELAELQLNLNLVEDAKLSLEKSIAWNQAQSKPYIMLITMATQEQNEQKTLSLLTKFEKSLKSSTAVNRISNNEIDSLLLNLKANLYWTLANNKKAEQLFKQSLNSQESKEAVIGLYRIYRQQKQFNLITQLLERWLKKHPNDLSLNIALGENYRMSKQLDKAQNFYHQLLKINPNNVMLLNNAAIIYKEMNQLENALALADKAHQLAPNNVNVIDTKASVLIDEKNYQAALPLLRKANSLDYDNAEVSYHLALTLDKLKRRAEALKHLIDAVESEQNFSEKQTATALLKAWQS